MSTRNAVSLHLIGLISSKARLQPRELSSTLPRGQIVSSLAETHYRRLHLDNFLQILSISYYDTFTDLNICAFIGREPEDLVAMEIRRIGMSSLSAQYLVLRASARLMFPLGLSCELWVPESPKSFWALPGTYSKLSLR